MLSKIKFQIKNNYKQYVFSIIYIAIACVVSFLIAKSHYHDNEATYEDVVFTEIGDSYVSEMFTLPESIQKTTVTYSSSVDCEIVMHADGGEIIRQAVPKAEGGNVVSVLHPIPKDTTTFYISFAGAAGSDLTIYNVNLLSTQSFNSDAKAKAALAFIGMIFVLVVILLTRNGVLKKENIIAVVILTVTTLFASGPLFIDYIPQGHDLWTHLGRIEGFKESLLDGQLIPVVIPSAFNSFGVLSFEYPQITLYIPALLRLLDVSVPLAYHIYMLLINIGTVIFTYWSCYTVLKNISEDKSEEKLTLISLGCTCFYELSAYRLTDMYVRASAGEVLAMMFLPLIVAGAYHLCVGDKRRWYMLFIGLTGIMQSHILTCMLIIPLVLLAVIIFCVRIIKERRWIQGLYTAVGFIVLNAWYIVPFVRFYMLPLNTDNLSEPNVANHIAPLSRMFSVILGSNATEGSEFTMSLGSAALIALLIIAVYLVEQIRNDKRLLDLNFVYVCILTVVFTIAVVLASDIVPYNYVKENCEKIWKMLEILQFPYRFLEMAVVCIAFACAIALQKSQAISKYSLIIVTLLVAVSILDSSRLLEDYQKNMPESVNMRTGNFTAHMPGDYLPAGSEMSTFEDSALYIGDGAILTYDRQGTNLTIEYSANAPTELTVPVLYYPCYKAVDEMGNRLELYQNSDKRIGVNVPQGEHTISLRARYSFW